VPLLNTAALDPSGTGVIATVFDGPHATNVVVETVSWSGAVTKLHGHTSGTMLVGHAGTVLVAEVGAGRDQLLVSTTTGAVVNRFEVTKFCSPVRWWDATRVLETCGPHGDLYLVDPQTGAADRFTKVHGPGDYGHTDARYAGSRLYVQVAGPCGYTYVAEVTRRGTRQVVVPGAKGSVVMVNAVGDHLVLEHTTSCDGQGAQWEITDFDPATQDETVLLRLPRHEDFGAVRLLGEVRASAY
jgi:hypothetical protein